MLIARIKSFVFSITQVFDYYNRNGIWMTISTIQRRSKKGRIHSYETLLNEHPQRFATSANLSLKSKNSWVTIINASAQVSLQKLMSKLDITDEVSNVLSMLKASHGKAKYYQTLDDLFAFDQVVSEPSDVVYPLMQASGLSELSGIPPRRRILFITSNFPSPNHGGGNRVLNFIKMLSEHNDIYLATAYSPREDDNLLHTIEPYCRSVYKIPRSRFVNNRAEIRKWLNGTPMDIVHYEWIDSLENHDPELGRFHIFTYMEAVSLRLFMDLKLTTPLSPNWLNIFAQLIRALRVEIADSTRPNIRIAVTSKDGDFLRGIYPHQEYVVLNHGVSLDEFCLPDVEPEPETLVFVGNFRHYPNIDAMVYFFSDIWDGILKEVPDVRIYLVGLNPPKEITRFADGRQIIITGSVPDVRPYIQKATVCIAPLITGAGLRGKVIEYAALHRTFVATSIATTDLVFKHGSEYMRADTALDFTQKTVLLLKDHQLRQKMADSAYEITRQNYDTRRLVDFLYRLYDHLELEQYKQ